MNIVDPIREKEYINAVKRVLNESGTRNLLLFLLGINTGLRVSDLLRLKVKDVKDKDSVQIREKKTKKTKKFPIPKEIRIFISEYLVHVFMYQILRIVSLSRNRMIRMKVIIWLVRSFICIQMIMLI